MQRKSQEIYELKLEVHRQQTQLNEQTKVLERQQQEIQALAGDKQSLCLKMEELESEADEWMEKCQLRESLARENEKKEGNIAKRVSDLQAQHEQEIIHLKHKCQKKVN